MKWLLTLLILFILTGGFLLSPSPVDSAAWQPPEAPALSGPLAPNERLQDADLLARGQVNGPEDVAIGADGLLYTGTADGRIVRIYPDGHTDTWLNTGGRPLGMAFDRRGRLIVADADEGLLAIGPDRIVTILAREQGGTLFRFTDDVAVAPDGRIYFTDASDRFHQKDYRLDLLETRPHGRFLRYSPRTGQVEKLIGNLYFANGVAVSPDGSFALVNETWKYRILRYWIKGPKAGRTEVFADNLPGFPDNLSIDGQGRVWVAFPTLRNATLDALHPYPWLKNLVAKLPDTLQPKPRTYGLVVAYDHQGRPLLSLHDTAGSHLKEITSVTPGNGSLYFGSLHNDRIGRLPLGAFSAAGDDQP
ncbi:SMP-30/gluconolactonase/LRE family protein [Marinobacter sp. C2H3]|uniref:SMP-30/gluconolactonase/LRE family protein n=1 Tax=Marinobacter sp. C2H3 TaxID=3119003 RepID=UPI00300F783D